MLKQKISDDLKAAMRAQDDVRRRTLRSLRAALLEKEIAGRQDEAAGALTEQEELSVVQKQAKQRRASIQQYEEHDRDDLADRERAELAVIEEYLPDQLSDDELGRVLHEIIQHTGATTRGDMGRVMGEAMKRLRGKVQGQRVQQRVRQMLAE